MRCMCRRYYMSMYRYTYGMRIIINPDNNWYVHKKTPNYNTYPSTYDVHAHMISPKYVLVHIRDDNYGMLLFSTFVNSLLHIRHLGNFKYRWMVVDTI